MVFCSFDNVDGCFADFFALRRRQDRAWSFFDQFLTASLNRAIPFAKIDIIAMLIADDLHLNMAWIDDHFFKIDIGIVKTDFGFGASSSKLSYKFIWIIGNADPFSPAAGTALMKMGYPSLFASLIRLYIFNNPIRSRNDRTFDTFGSGFGFGFISEKSNRFRRRPNKIDAAACANRGKIGIFT